eukprot:jgi/Bigna1/81595/fgenesh1_pg.82_\
MQTYHLVSRLGVRKAWTTHALMSTYISPSPNSHCRCGGYIRFFSSKSNSGGAPSDEEGVARRRARATYQRAQEKKELTKEKEAGTAKFPIPKQRISPLREAFENQQRSLRPGELPGVASLGGLGEYSLAEAQIQSAMQEGQLTNLSGSHEPIQRRYEDDLRLWVDDAGMRVINRVLETNGFKPRSLELRESVEQEIRSLSAAIKRLVSTVEARNQDDFSKSAEVNALSVLASSCNVTISSYNDAVLKDLITYGSGWPLNQRSPVNLTEMAKELWLKVTSK